MYTNIPTVKDYASEVGGNLYEAGQKEHQITIAAKSSCAI